MEKEPFSTPLLKRYIGARFSLFIQISIIINEFDSYTQFRLSMRRLASNLNYRPKSVCSPVQIRLDALEELL